MVFSIGQVAVVLHLAKFAEDAVRAVEEFGGRAVFGNFSVVKNDNPVHVVQGGKAVGDGDDGFVLNQVLQGFFNQGFRLAVKCGGCFVQNEHGCVLQNGAGNRNTLPFAAGKQNAAFADDAVVSLGKFHNRIVNAGETGSIADLSGCGFGVGDTQVFSYGTVEQRCVLRNDGDVLMQGAELQIPNVGVVNEDFAGGNVIGAQEQVDEGGFAGA